MAGTDYNAVCDWCQNRYGRMDGDTGTRCALCLYLGDRSLVHLLLDPTPEAIARFRAAPAGRLRFQREGGNYAKPSRA